MCGTLFLELGNQRDPKPGVHNSGWVQSPGAKLLADAREHDALKEYVTGVISLFKSDQRVMPGICSTSRTTPIDRAMASKELAEKSDLALALLKKTVAWAREVDPSQPLTAGVWQGTGRAETSSRRSIA